MAYPIYNKKDLENLKSDFSRLESDVPNWSDLSDEELRDLIEREYQNLTLESLNLSNAKYHKLRKKIDKVKDKRPKPSAELNFPYKIEIIPSGKVYFSYSNPKSLMKCELAQLYRQDGIESNWKLKRGKFKVWDIRQNPPKEL